MAAEGLNMALQAASHVPALSSTITVMDTSGKVINTSRSVFSAFKEARMAYRTRKAEIAEERSRQSARRDEARLRAARKHSTTRRLERSNTGQLMIEDDEERRQRKKEKKEKKKRSESTSPSGTGSDSGTSSDISFEDDSGSTVLTATNNNNVRRSNSSETMRTEATLYTPGGLRGNMSVISLIPEMVLSQPDPMTENLQLLLMQLQATIDELSCWSAGIGALISELQKVPDTLAVVGLTLAEVSALVAKVSPAAIMGLKTLFPMIFALLGSPQFVVLAGVGAAATVIVLGGYKIIKNVVGGAAKASLSAGDEDEYPEGDWDEPVEEVVREPPQQRMIEAAPVPPPQPETRRAQSQAPTQRKQLMPARAHTFQAPGSGSEALAFDVSSAANSSGESSNNSSNSNSNNNSADEEEDKKRHHRKRRGSNDKSDKDKSERSRSKSGSSSHHSKSKSDKEKDKSEKDKSSSKSGKHESSEPSGRRGSSSKSHDKHEKSDKKERKTSVDSGTTTPIKEKKPFFSLTTSPFSSPAASTASLPTEKQKKKERKSSLSSTSSSPSSGSKEKEKEKEKEKTTSTKEHKETKKPKELLLGLFEGRSHGRLA